MYTGTYIYFYSGEMLSSWITDSYLRAVKIWINAINLSCKNLAVYVFTDIVIVSYCPKLYKNSACQLFL